MAKGSKNRIDFNKGVPETLYKRANGHCSVPRCKIPTMGPFKENEGAVNLGIACHIYSAAVNGPRGRGGKSDDFIASAENGIWCCSHHGSLIDKAKGRDFPADDLFLWKAIAEARTRKQMHDTPSPLGWVDSLELLKLPGFTRVPKLTLSRLNLLWGQNDTGKSVTLEASASLSSATHADRLMSGNPGIYDSLDESSQIVCKVTYSTVDSLSKELEIHIRDGFLSRREGSTVYLLPPGDIEIVYCSDEEVRQRSHEDDFEYLMRVVGVDSSALLALNSDSGTGLTLGELSFRKATVWDDSEECDRGKYKPNGERYIEAVVAMRDFDAEVTLNNLSSSQHGQLILDLQIRKAREVCKQRLTLLIVDPLCRSFQIEKFSTLLSTVEKEDFQCLIQIPGKVECLIFEMKDGNFLKSVDGKPLLLDAAPVTKWRLVTTPPREIRPRLPK